jgi:antitoxin ParD1/3/4
LAGIYLLLTKFAINLSKVAKLATLNVSLPDRLRSWIDSQVESGEYANASDYIRDLVRHDQRQREALQLALMEGEQSGLSERSVGDIIRAAKSQMENG